MLDFWTAVIIGIVEGLTEYLPVSSTGHMILVGHLLDFRGDVAEAFEISIQLGAILSVVVLYWRRVLRLFGVRPPGTDPNAPSINLNHVLIAILPAMIVGFLLDDFIDDCLFRPETVLIGLVLGGIFMIVAEKISRR